MKKYIDAFKRLKKEISGIAEKEECSVISLYRNAFWCFVRFGITPNEYLGWNCWRYSNRMLKSFYTARHSAKYEGIFNNQSYAHFFDNKVDFNKKFTQFVNRDWIYTKESQEAEIVDFLQSHNKVIAKPIGLSSGRGIHVVDKGTNLGGDYKDCLLESFIKQHTKMSELNPSSVNSVRVYTLIQKNGVPKILSASIRVGGKEAEVDNYHAGGCGYPIDIKTGIVYMPGTDIKGSQHVFHPSTGYKMIGFEVPNWQELIQFVFKAMAVIPEIRLPAWDVAVLDEGFEMIEGNCNGDPGFMQAPSKIGKKREILKEL